MLLNRVYQVLGYVNLAKGGANGCVIDTKVVMQYALKANASGVIMAHNHPSDNLMPSDADKKITEELKRALSHMGLSLLDHLIITSDEEYKSIMDFI